MAIPFWKPISEDVRWSVTDLSTSVSSQFFTTLHRLAAGMEGAAQPDSALSFIDAYANPKQPAYWSAW
jgi:hypothetical protein